MTIREKRHMKTILALVVGWNTLAGGASSEAMNNELKGVRFDSRENKLALNNVGVMIMERLYKAIAQGQELAFKDECDQASPILLNMRNYKTGRTLLTMAVEDNQEHMVRCLLANGASPDVRDYANNTAFAYIPVKDEETILDKRIKENIINIMLTKVDQALLPTLTTEAACHGNIDLLKIIRNKGVSFNEMNESTLPPLVSAILGKKADVVRFLCDNGADPHLSLTKCGMKDKTCIAFAVRSAEVYPEFRKTYLDIIEFLCTKKVDLAEALSKARTPEVVTLLEKYKELQAEMRKNKNKKKKEGRKQKKKEEKQENVSDEESKQSAAESQVALVKDSVSHEVVADNKEDASSEEIVCVNGMMSDREKVMCTVDIQEELCAGDVLALCESVSTVEVDVPAAENKQEVVPEDSIFGIQDSLGEAESLVSVAENKEEVTSGDIVFGVSDSMPKVEDQVCAVDNKETMPEKSTFSITDTLSDAESKESAIEEQGIIEQPETVLYQEQQVEPLLVHLPSPARALLPVTQQQHTSPLLSPSPSLLPSQVPLLLQLRSPSPLQLPPPLQTHVQSQENQQRYGSLRSRSLQGQQQTLDRLPSAGTIVFPAQEVIGNRAEESQAIACVKWKELMGASWNGSTRVIEQLKQFFRDSICLSTDVINEINGQGNTPLFVAIKNGHINFARILLLEFPVAKVGLYIKNNDNQHVLDFLFDGSRSITIVEDTFYVPDMLMSLLKNPSHRDSLSIRGLIEAMFSSQDNVPLFIPQGEYFGYELLKMICEESFTSALYNEYPVSVPWVNDERN